jgi:uncharacterized protein
MSTAKQNTEAEIEAFAAVCDRLAGFSERISVEWADGYLTALCAGPRALAIEEWLPRLAGDAFERAFADPDDVAQATQALQQRFDAIADQLDPGRLLDDEDVLQLNPLMSEWSDEDKQRIIDEGKLSAEDAQFPALGEIWALGFLDATEDFADDWPAPDLSSDTGQYYDECLARVTALILPEGSDDLREHLQSLYAGQQLTRDELVDEACFAAQDLRLYWVEHAPKPATRRVERTPGRNDPCPCGSGKKYKKCHGAQ